MPVNLLESTRTEFNFLRLKPELCRFRRIVAPAKVDRISTSSEMMNWQYAKPCRHVHLGTRIKL